MKVTLTSLLTFCLAGCFSEQSFPVRRGDIVRVVSPVKNERLTVRPWLDCAHQSLKSLLPARHEPALLTNDLADASGRPVDVGRHFHLDFAAADKILCNYHGLHYTAQTSGNDYVPGKRRINWADYEELWIPVNNQVSLFGYFGRAHDNGQEVDADCIVILPGLLGHCDIYRTKDLCDALRSCGHHVLALEPRGHGRVNERFPDAYYTFGVLETCDLMIVSEWLQAQPHIRRTGLIGFCWGANLALLAAWYDHRPDIHPSISERLAPHMRPVSQKKHYEAGVMAFSPVLRFEDIVEAVQTPQPKLVHPVLSTLQETVRHRMEQKCLPNPCGNLRTLIDDEFARSELSYAGSVEDALDFVRFTPHRGRTDGNKLADARIPVLIVQAANDPLTSGQAVADLFARLSNPNVAGLILASGGHIGFAAYNRPYYFSLIMNFFDPANGPIAAPSSSPRVSSGPRSAYPPALSFAFKTALQ